MITTNPDLYSLQIEKPGENMLGTHILLELHHCDQQVIDNLQTVDNVLTGAARVAGAVVVDRFFHRFEPHGISGVVVISTSHIAIHTWPEYGFAAIDIFTCGREMENDLAVSHIVSRFAPKDWQLAQLPRGEFPLLSTDAVRHAVTAQPGLKQFPPRSLDRPEIKSLFGRGNGTGHVAPVTKLPDAVGPANWDVERAYSGEQHHFEVKRVIASGKSQYQHYSLIDTVSYGLMLFLDHCGQSAEQDEHIYHECLVQPAMLTHDQPKRVLVIGAGEGATAREILYHDDVQRLVLVDLDSEVVELCKRHLHSFHRGAFDDPRVEIVYEDGYRFVERCKERFDVIIIDVVDDLDDSPAAKLYASEFFTLLKAHCLAENGIVVVQSMELSELEFKDHFRVHAALKENFHHVCSYNTFVPSFWSVWGYCIASDVFDFRSPAGGERIAATIERKGLNAKLKYFDDELFVKSHTLTKTLREKLKQVRFGGTTL